MARSKTGVTARRRHKKILKLAMVIMAQMESPVQKGERVGHALVGVCIAATAAGKNGDFRRLWIARINAAFA